MTSNTYFLPRQFTFCLCICLWGMLIVSCDSFFPSEVTVTVTEETTLPPPLFPAAFDGAIAFIYNTDVFYLEGGDSSARQVTVGVPGIKRRVALSYNHEKIAFINQNQRPVIINRQGEVIGLPTASGPVLDIGWLPGDETLYMLVGNGLEYDGPSIDLPEFTFADITPSSVSVSRNLDVAYVGADNFDRGVFQIHYSSPSLNSVSRATGNLLSWVRFHPAANRLLFASEESDSDRLNSNNVVFLLIEQNNSYTSVASGQLSSVVHGPGGSYIYALRTDAISNERVPFDNIFWRTSVLSQPTLESALTFYPEIANYVSVDWKP